jgi:hypothetical protein
MLFCFYFLNDNYCIIDMQCEIIKLEILMTLSSIISPHQICGLYSCFRPTRSSYHAKFRSTAHAEELKNICIILVQYQ